MSAPGVLRKWLEHSMTAGSSGTVCRVMRVNFHLVRSRQRRANSHLTVVGAHEASLLRAL